MDPRFAEVKVLIWDFDGTLYKPNPELWQEVREAEYRVIASHTGWSRQRVVAEFARLHKKVYASATEVTAILSNISTPEAAVEMEQYFDRRNHLRRDEKLTRLFQKLKGYRHFTLANGVREKHIQTLELLGVRPQTFEEMVTSEVVGFTKPHEKGFRYILGKTGLPPQVHLMIGDREGVDIVPAKKLGMKTCFVWGDSKVADISLPTVYEVSNILVN